MSSNAAYKKTVKKGVTEDDARRRRQNTTVNLRKEKREEGLQKRRNLAVAEVGIDSSAPASSADLSLDNLPSYCDGSWVWRANAMSAWLRGLSLIYHFLTIARMHHPSPLHSPIAAARSSDPAQQIEGVTAIRRLLSKESRPPVEPVVQSGIMPRLIELLASPDAKIQFEAAWAITNIASTEHTRVVVDAGAIPALVQGMMASSPEVRDQCIWCLGNVAGDCVKNRDLLFNTPGALQALMLNIQHPETPTLLQNATWTLSNFCRGKPAPPQATVAAMLPALAFLLRQGDKSVLSDAAWGISYLTDNE